MRNITAWILSVLVGLAFIGAGAAKLSSQTMMVAEFQVFGYPLWFMYLTGTLEVVSGLLLFVPRYAGIGAALLACTMTCALISHLTHAQAAMIGAPLVLLVLSVAIGVLRDWSGLKPPRASSESSIAAV